MTRRSSAWLVRASLALAAAALAGGLWWLAPSAPVAVPSTPADGFVPTDAATIERGRYLATVGNCQHCHTARGGPAFAGGRALHTPFGVVFSSNLTPSATGLANWTAADFWRALHHGQSRDGRWLSPAFPFGNTTHIARADSDAIHAYLRTLPPVDKAVPPHELAWPFNTQAALKVWRALYFTPGAADPAAVPDATVPNAQAAAPDVLRGAYLVRGLGHCSACHAPRDALGGSRQPLALSGGLMPGQNWYAPSLTAPAEAGLQDWSATDVVALFQTGRAGQAVVTGPMAEVVQHSTQHWHLDDLQALAAYLRQLPRTPPTEAPGAPRAPDPGPAPTATTGNTAFAAALGARLYKQHCAQCHGDEGEGRPLASGRPGYTALAGNRAVLLASPVNLVQQVMNGGYAPATAGHPRPLGMPPFVLALSDADMAAVLTHIRTQWGNRASPVSALDVQTLRGGPRH